MATHSGGCLCGAVRFELRGDPEFAAYCHCTRCQRRTGTAAAPNLRVAAGSVRVLDGAGEIRTWVPPGGGAPKCFCGVCGGALWSTDADGVVRGVRRAAFDTDPGTPFRHRQFVASAAAWEPIPDDGLPRYDGAPA